MSSSVASVDLSTAVAGSTGTMDWSGFGLPTGQSKPARLQLFNESGCGLRCVMTGSGRSFDFPAGGWMQDAIELQPGERGLTYTVQYVIPNAPVSLLLATYFGPGERSVGVSLGNSPIGITGSVSTSTVTSLVQDGQAVGTQLIEATPTGQSGASWNVNNDGSGTIQILSAGSLRKILQATRGDSGSGHATVAIGDAGDVSMTTLNGLLAAANVQAGNLGASVAAAAAALQAGTIPAGVILLASQLSFPGSIQTTLNGTTAGTAVYAQPITGTAFKVFYCFVNGYENTTATAQAIHIPTPFTTSAIAINIGAGTSWLPKTAGSADITFSETTLGTGTSSGTQSGRTGQPFSTIGHITGAIEHLDLPASMGSTVTGWYILIGY